MSPYLVPEIVVYPRGSRISIRKIIIQTTTTNLHSPSLQGGEVHWENRQVNHTFKMAVILKHECAEES